MDSFPYENWLHDQINGVPGQLGFQSPENWLRVALRESFEVPDAIEQVPAEPGR